MSQYNHNGEDGHGSGDFEGPSDTDDDDDDEERLDCVHDIHGDGEEADDEDVENGASIPIHISSNDGAHRQQMIIANDSDVERPLVHDSSMDGDIEDTVEGQDTDRIVKKRPSLFNKLQGVEQQSSVDSDHHFKKKTAGGSK